MGKTKAKYYFRWALVVTQLVERSLPTPEVHGSNPVIGKFLCATFVYYQLYFIEKTKINNKRPRNGPFLNK